MVVMTRTIQIRMTRDQYQQIKDYSRVKGFNSLSGYLRFMALHQDFVLLQKVSEIHAHLLGSQPAGKYKKNPAAASR
jgi:hypothetical protein